mmetsp:Transcript_132618/g.424389  ORF Transcript_132618/g.424389 Transcript_132618/m.424389 type:complete len:408 (-) Transcript_132618:7-1230(-)
MVVADAAESPEDRASMARRVKAFQKGSDRGRLLWHQFCDTYCDGVRDPRNLLEAPVRRFLDEADSALALEPSLPPEGEETRRKAKPARRPIVAADDADAARARMAAVVGDEGGEAVLRHMPAEWRPLYEKTIRLDYGADRYNFVEVVRAMLDCPEDVPLCRLHEVKRPPDFEPCPPLRKGMQLAGMRLAPEKQGGAKSKNGLNRAWQNSSAYNRFLDLYRRFLREVVLPTFCGTEECGVLAEAAVQSSPVLRVVMPSAHVATCLHKDGDYGHVPEELNFWVPLTPVGGSNSLHVEGFPGRRNFEAFSGQVGHAFRFWGNQCAHYAEPNTTESTRVSFDFRLIPLHFWDVAEVGGLLSAAARRRTFFHEGELAIGYYYQLERASMPSPSQKMRPEGVAQDADESDGSR